MKARTTSAALALTLAASLALSGCATTTPKGRLLARLNDVTQAANAKDAPGIRTAVGRFNLEVSAQGDAGNLTVAKVAILKSIAASVLADADLVDQGKVDDQARASAAASASAAAAASASASSAAAAASASAAAASPSPSPSPTPSPSPSPTPTAARTPSPTPSPSRSRVPDLLPTPEISSSPGTPG